MHLFRSRRWRTSFLAGAGLLIGLAFQPSSLQAQPLVPTAPPPVPLIDQTHPAVWVFAYKFNAANFPTPPVTHCLFGGSPHAPSSDKSSLYYAATWSGLGTLASGSGLIGTELTDPLGATFSEIYNGNWSYVVWNDQFDAHPSLPSCQKDCPGPWGHSKGILAWDDAGNGLVLQVSTPSWPGSGSVAQPRAGKGNTLGCNTKNNIVFAQHFFALRLTPADTAAVLDALANASVATDPNNPQIARVGGPPELSARAMRLGHLSRSSDPTDVMLSSGIRLISKPSNLHVPPWQFLSARLQAVPLRAATWWASPRLPTTNPGRLITCWRDDLGTPGRVEVALTGQWQAKAIGLAGSQNHAKIGVSLDPSHPYTIFGDLNQQGRLTGNCASSQNGRGGLFFILSDPTLYASVNQLIAGKTASTAVPGTVPKKPKTASVDRSR